MHVYIYDEYLNKTKYNRAINRLEIRLTDLGLNGKIIRLNNVKNIKSAVQNEIKIGSKTIIAVGNNQTVNKIIGAIIDTDLYDDFQQKTLLGIIPIGDDNSIANSFGIKNAEDACNILLARRIENIDIGLAGDNYFLNQSTIESAGTTLEINGCTIETQEKGEIKIINLLSDKKETIKPNPHDGKLEVLIRTRKRDQTFLTVKTLRLHNPSHQLIVDDVVKIDTPVEINVKKAKLNIIVGKDRLFE